MASWSEVEREAPELAARARALFDGFTHKTMATLRRDGSPRISGTELEFAGGEIRIGSMPGSVKAKDLERDPRIAIHGPTSDPPEGDQRAWPGEAKIAGTAIEVDSGGDFHRFLIDLQEAVITRLDDAGNGLVIESWTPERGLRTVRRT